MLPLCGVKSLLLKRAACVPWESAGYPIGIGQLQAQKHKDFWTP